MPFHQFANHDNSGRVRICPMKIALLALILISLTVLVLAIVFGIKHPKNKGFVWMGVISAVVYLVAIFTKYVYGRSSNALGIKPIILTPEEKNELRAREEYNKFG